MNSKISVIIKRELKEKLLSKAFIISTLLIPAFMIGIIGLQTLFMTVEGNEDTSLLVLTDSEKIANSMNVLITTDEFKNSTDFKLKIIYTSENLIKEEIENHKSKVLSKELTGIFFIPTNAEVNKKIEYYSDNPNNKSLFDKLSAHINTVLMEIYFENKGISEEDIKFARMGVDYNGFRLSEKEETKQEGFGNKVLSFIFAFLLYMTLIILGSQMLRSVFEEKANRIVEILLSSIQSKQLIAGKIIGNTITGVIQMMVWLTPILYLGTSSVMLLPKEFMIDFNLGNFAYFIFNYLLGLLIYLGLFAAVGSIYDNDQDAQSGLAPVMMLIMIPFFITFSMINNPANSIAELASMLPFASIIVMPTRMALINVPVWQILIAVFVNISTVFAVIIITGKIYQTGILFSGKKPGWKEIVQWIKS